MPKAKLDLEPSGEGYLLTRVDEEGKQSEMALSEDDVIKLGVAAPRILQTVLRSRTRIGAHAVALTPISQIGVEVDLHKSALHITFVDPGGVELLFLLPQDVGSILRERLALRLDEIAANHPVKH